MRPVKKSPIITVEELSKMEFKYKGNQGPLLHMFMRNDLVWIMEKVAPGQYKLINTYTKENK